MLTLLFALLSVPEPLTLKTVNSLPELDALCDGGRFERPIAFPLDGGSFELVPAGELEGDPFVRAPRPLRALSGQVTIHLVERTSLAWTGMLDERSARALLAQKEARATAVGHLEEAPGFPTCFGHRQSGHRIVSMKLEALYLYGDSGHPIGRYAEPAVESAQRPGLRTELNVRCGVPCGYDQVALEAALTGNIRSSLMACTTGSPEGTLAFEVAGVPGGSGTTIRGEVSTLPGNVRRCARNVLDQLRLPASPSPGVVLLDVSVSENNAGSES